MDEGVAFRRQPRTGTCPRFVAEASEPEAALDLAPLPLTGDRAPSAELDICGSLIECEVSPATLDAASKLAASWSTTSTRVWLTAFAAFIRRQGEEERFHVVVADTPGSAPRCVELAVDPRATGRALHAHIERALSGPRTTRLEPALGFEVFMPSPELPPGTVQVRQHLRLAAPTGETNRLRWTYKLAIFDPATIDAYTKRLERLVQSLAGAPDRPIAELELVPDDEQRLLERYGDGITVPAWTHETTPAIFARHVLERPTATAVVCGGQRLTYGELDAAAAALAGHLRRAGVRAGSKVASFVDRGLHLVTAVIGIWKAGAIYLPIDPDDPPARIRLLLEDAGVDALLTEASVRGRLPTDVPVPRVDLHEGIAAPRTDDCTPARAAPCDTAYILYTSGSTGRPKGVRICHASLACHLRAMTNTPGLQPGDRVLAMTTVSFDISLLELLLPLVVGAQSIVVSRMVARDPSLLAAALERHDVTFMQATPSSWGLLVSSGWTGRPGLTALSGGEAMTPALARALLDRCARLWNVYGPTEATIWSSAQRIDAALVDRYARAASMPIGGPLHNVAYQVVDATGRVAPLGVPGELWIGGPLVAQGYHARAELTAERFVERDGIRFYRTGDRVRLSRDGTFAYHGRFDHQVKLRGHRIELGEIEVAIVEHDDVREAAVTVCADPSGTPRLVGFVRLRAGTSCTNELRAFLQSRLPAHMVPNRLVVLDRFPLTPSGKIDREALPAPRLEMPEASLLRAVELGDPVVAQLLAIWAQLLGRADLQPRDDFFAVGGHSLLAVELARRIERCFGRTLPVHALFAAPTVLTQAELVREDVRIASQMLDPIKPTGSRPPVFFVGSTGYAKAFAEVLPAEQPMYGLKIFGLRRDDEHPLEVDAIAAAFVAAMREVQPRGPYHLAAYCDDCKVAFAMAQQLRAAGERVATLAYIDALWVVERERRADHVWRNLRSQGLRWIGCKLHERARLIVKRMQRVRERLALDLQRRRGVNASVLQHDVLLLDAYRAALTRCAPRSYPGDLAVILSDEYTAPDSPDALRAMALGKVEVAKVGGLHGDVFRPPHIERVAHLLTELVARASADP